MATSKSHRILKQAVVETLDKRQMMSATISGNLIADNNANYSWDAGDTRNVGWTAYIDANDNGTLDGGERSAVSNNDGFFSLTGLAAGTYRVRQVMPDGWRQTFPANRDYYDVTVANGQTGTATFGATQAMSNVDGAVFNDANNNGEWDADEAAEANRIVYFDTNDNGLQEATERWTTTDANGKFQFFGLPSGSYRIRLVQSHGWTQTFGHDSALAIVNGSDSVWGMRFAHSQDAEPSMYSADKILSFMLIGASNDNDADRRVAYNIKAEGWTGFIEDYVQPQIAWGVRRIMLHNPFGSLSTEGDYLADQAIVARQAGLNWLLDDFVAAWTPITAAGIEVVAYMGTPMNNASFAGLNDTDWWARVWESYDLPIDAGMKIGLDKSLAANPGSRDWEMVEEFRDLGSDVYGEPRPPASSPHWTSTNLLAEDHIWLLTRPETNPETHWAANDSQITGDVARWISAPPSGQSWNNMATWAPAYVRRILREGHTAALNVAPLIAANISMTELLTPVASASRAMAAAAAPAQPTMLSSMADDFTRWTDAFDSRDIDAAVVDSLSL